MSFFEWTEELDVKVDKMNTEHQKLIQLMNVLYDCSQDETKHAMLPAKLKSFCDFVVLHFNDEEGLESSGWVLN